MTLLVSPAPRWKAMFAELPTSSELVLFGGQTNSDVFNGATAINGTLNDTWKWTEAGGWANLLTGVSGNTLSNPSPRFSAAMSYDGSKVTMVGGTDGKSSFSDTWSYSTAGGWVQQNLTNSISSTGTYAIPTTLKEAAMAYQSGSSEAILFGGTAPYQRHYVLDTWTWTAGSPGTWTLLTPPNSASGRINQAMASSSTTLVMFGGKNFDGALSDTWTFGGISWSQITGFTPGSTCPSARYGASMVFDSSTSLFLLFGGYNVNGYLNDLWKFNTSGNTWTNITPATSPSPRAFSAMAFNSAAGNSILFGGIDYQTGYGDTWKLTNSAGTYSWAQQ